MTTKFSHYPSAPRSPKLQRSYIILCNAHDTASSFIETFASVRMARNALGTPTDEEQDLLRASLVFSSAGLDSLAKQLIKDALPSVIDSSKPASTMFAKFVEKRLRQGDQANYALLSGALVSQNSRAQLVSMYIWELTSGSLQSCEAILKAGAAFDIKSADLTSDPVKLKATFDVRNKIVHEMDVDFDHLNRNRCSRALRRMVSHCNRVFGVANEFLLNVDGKLST